MVTLRGPVHIALRRFHARGEVGDLEKRIGLVEHDQEVARGHVFVDLRDQAFGAQAKELLRGIARNLKELELAALQRRLERKAGEPRLERPFGRAALPEIGAVVGPQEHDRPRGRQERDARAALEERGTRGGAPASPCAASFQKHRSLEIPSDCLCPILR